MPAIRQISHTGSQGEHIPLIAPENVLHSVPGGIAKPPFIKGGLEKAGIACKGGPGLNCIPENTGCAIVTRKSA